MPHSARCSARKRSFRLRNAVAPCSLAAGVSRRMRWQFFGSRSGTNVRPAPARAGARALHEPRRAGVGAVGAWLVLAFAAIEACTPDDLGATCHFDGETTNACGKCIAASCQMTVDTCCGNESCRASLSALDTCASGGGCSSLFVASSSMGKLLASCVEGLCSDVCTETGGPLVACVRDEDAQSCSCTSGGAVDGSAVSSCSLLGTSDGICCSESDWPASGSSCACVETGCVDLGDGEDCRCGLVRDLFVPGIRVTVQSFCSSPSGYCCKEEDGTCSCGTSPCGGSEEVSTCWAYDVKTSCPSGLTEVRACH